MRLRRSLLSLVLLGAAAGGARGQLLHVQQIHDGRTGVSAVRTLAASPDGRSLYVGGAGTLAAFARNPATGALSFLDLYRGEGLSGAILAVVALDGEHVYAAGEGRDFLAVFRRDAKGKLDLLRVHRHDAELGQISSLAVAPNGSLFVVGDGIEGAVAAFRPETTGELTLVDVERGALGLAYTGPLAVSPDGKTLYVGSSDGAIVAFAVRRSRQLDRVAAARQGSDGVDGLAGISDLTVSPDGRHLYSSSDRGVTAVFRRGSSGALTFLEVIPAPEPAFDSRRVAALSADGAHLYACHHSGGLLEVWRRHAATGSLSLVTTVPGGGETAPSGLGCAALALSPDGENLYTPGSFDRGLGRFARQATGALTFQDFLEEGEGAPPTLRRVYDVALSPDGRHVYAASLDESAIGLYHGDPATGALAFAHRVEEGMDRVRGIRFVDQIALSPDGRHLYAVGRNEQAQATLAVFRRDAETGVLTFVRARLNDFGGVFSSGSTVSLAVSSDGRSVYVASDIHDLIVVYRRIARTGWLRVAQRVREAGFADPTALAISPGRTHLYATLANPGGLAIFARSRNGRLSWLGVEPAAASRCVHGLLLASSLALSPGGEHLYATSDFTAEVHAFSRDAATGGLELLDCGFGPSVVRIAMGPDGAYLYAVDTIDGIVTAFARDGASGLLEPAGSVSLPSALNSGDPMPSDDGRNLYVPAGNGGLIVLDAGNATAVDATSPGA